MRLFVNIANVMHLSMPPTYDQVMSGAYRKEDSSSATVTATTTTNNSTNNNNTNQTSVSIV